MFGFRAYIPWEMSTETPCSSQVFGNFQGRRRRGTEGLGLKSCYPPHVRVAEIPHEIAPHWFGINGGDSSSRRAIVLRSH